MIHPKRVFPDLVKLPAAGFVILAACGFMTPGGVPAEAGDKKYAQEYRHQFKGPLENASKFTLVGPDAQTHVKFEPEGLRITLPAGHAKERKGTGVATGFALRGDFEITLGFEILNEPTPEDAGPKTRLSLVANLDKPNPELNQAALSRRITLKNGVQNVTWMILRPDNAKKSESTIAGIPALEKRGRFRLVRAGGDIAYHVAEGADGAWKLVNTYEFSTADVRDVAIVGSTGGDKAALDVRVSELVVRADAFPGTPPVRKKLEPNPTDPAAGPGPPGPASRQEKRGFLIAILLIGVAVLGIVAVALAYFLHKRRGSVSHAPSAAFACPQCGKPLKAKADMTGKNVKCPKCGAVVPVPAA